MQWRPSRWRRTRTRSPAQVRRPGCLSICSRTPSRVTVLSGATVRASSWQSDVGEVHAPERDKGGSRIGGGPAEAGVVGREEVLAQIAVGEGGRRDPGHAEFIDEAILKGAVEAFAAAAGLGGVGGDVLDAQAGEGAADL